jgi:hypothetical protein
MQPTPSVLPTPNLVSLTLATTLSQSNDASPYSEGMNLACVEVPNLKFLNIVRKFYTIHLCILVPQLSTLELRIQPIQPNHLTAFVKSLPAVEILHIDSDIFVGSTFT